MANYQLLKADIDKKVYQNGHQEITGANLNSVLNAMVSTLGAEYQFAGVATKDTNPETTDAKVFYIANGKGTYTNFGGLEVTEDEVVVLYWDSSWHKESTGIASQAKLTELDKQIKDETLSVAIQQGQGFVSRLDVDKKANEYVVVNFKTDANIVYYTLYYANKQSELKLFKALEPNKEYAYKLPEDAIFLAADFDKSAVLSSGTGEFIIYRSENEALEICDKESQEKLVESLAYTNKKTFNDIPVYNGKYLKGNGTLSDDDPLGYYSDILPVVNGDSFIYSGKVTYQPTVMYVITDIYGVVLSKFNTIGTYTDKTITINEPNAAYIRFGSYEIKPTIKINYSPSMQQYVDGKIADLASKISDTNVRPKTLYNLYNPTTATKGKYVNPPTGELRDSAEHYASDFIPVENGQYYTFPIDPSFFGVIAAKNIATYDASKTYLDIVTGEISETNPYLLTIHITNENVKYIRVSALKKLDRYQYKWLQSYDTFMVVNAKSYPTRYYPYGEIPQYLEGELSPENYAMTNPLFGKSVIFDGDSICHAIEDINRYGWAGRIGTKNKMLWQNLSIGGGTFTNGGWGSHVISETDYGVANPDYIIIEGGTNDADDIGSIIDGSTPEKYGSFSLTGYTDNFTTATYCGAIESLFKRLLSTYPKAKIGVIIAQKMGVSDDYTPTGNNRRAYFETLIKLCEKWGIPYINLWDRGRLNPSLSAYYTADNPDSFYTDGQHLTPNGYDVITPMIEEWMKTL